MRSAMLRFHKFYYFKNYFNYLTMLQSLYSVFFSSPTLYITTGKSEVWLYLKIGWVRIPVTILTNMLSSLEMDGEDWVDNPWDQFCVNYATMLCSRFSGCLGLGLRELPPNVRISTGILQLQPLLSYCQTPIVIAFVLVFVVVVIKIQLFI